MMYFLRPYKCLGFAALVSLGMGFAASPPAAAQSAISQFIQQLDPLLSHSNSQGYLGVLVTDVDTESAPKLKLKDTHGAVITLIDHDAPAGQNGLKVNDVILGLNGHTVDGKEQFDRALREIPAGRKVQMLISREGNQQTIVIELVDRKAMEHDVWNKMNKDTESSPSTPALGILPGGGDAPLPGFHMPFFGSSLNVGALVEPLTSQMADYLGVPSGIMVKQITRKSEAAASGLKPFDVIVKVGADAIKTTADWDRALHSNQGKSVQVVILRDRKQLLVNLQVDSKRRSSVAKPIADQPV
jgi:S1-C subfamily serine protease